MFWALKCLPDKSYTQTPPMGTRLTQAALGAEAQPGRTTLLVKVDSTKYALCSLTTNSVENCSLDIMFGQGQTITFSVVGDSPVYVSGYYLPEEEDMEGEMEDEFGVRPQVDFDEFDASPEDEQTEENTKKNAALKALFAGNEQESDSDEQDDDYFPSSEEEGDHVIPANEVEAEDDDDEDDDDEDSGSFDVGATLGVDTSKDDKKSKKNNKKRRSSEEDDDAPPAKRAKNSANAETGAAASKAAKKAAKKEQQKKQKEAEQQKRKEQQEAAAAQAKAKKDKESKKSKKDKAKDKGAAWAGGAPVRRLSGGLEIADLTEGHGRLAKPGKKVVVKYVGKLDRNGKKFDSANSFGFHLGTRSVIEGWDVGVAGMRVGAKRRLRIPPAMGYGNQDMGDIPPNSTLLFDVELLKVK